MVLMNLRNSSIFYNKKNILKEDKIIMNVKYPLVFKSVKISDETHKKLQSIVKVKETFEDVIKRLLDNYSKEKDSLMQVLKIPGNRNIEINFTKQENDWTDKDYDLFVKKIFSMDEAKWRENVLKRIANNEVWFEEILRYRNE
jgi:predicted CopG family antitoxin